MKTRDGDGDEEQPKAQDKKTRMQVYVLFTHMLLNVTNLAMLAAGRLPLLQEHGGLSVPECGVAMALFSSLTSLLEFLLNPLAGMISDAAGRRLVILQAPAVSILSKVIVFLRPSYYTIAMERILSGCTTTIGGSTSCNAALADLILDTKQLAGAYATCGTFIGFGVIVGPMIGAISARMRNTSRDVYLAAAAVSTVQLLISSSFLRESLAPEKRKPIRREELAHKLNPFNVLKLFQYSPHVAKLTSCASLQCFLEGKSVSDLNQYTIAHMNFTPEERASFTSGFGIAMTLSGMIGSFTVMKLGLRGHTTFQNGMSALGNVFLANTTSKPMLFCCLFFYCFSMERRSATSALASTAAKEANMGMGEFNAAFANLRALAVGIAPLVYSRMFALGLSRKPPFPGLPWLTAAVVALLCELLHRSVSGADIQMLAAARESKK